MSIRESESFGSRNLRVDILLRASFSAKMTLICLLVYLREALFRKNTKNTFPGIPWGVFSVEIGDGIL